MNQLLYNNSDIVHDVEIFEPSRPTIKKGKKKQPKAAHGGRQPRREPKEFNLRIKEIAPKTENQKKVFQGYGEGQNVLLHGIAGTGKTFISLYLALSDVLAQGSQYKKVVIIRSVVPSRDMGFLPGKPEEKSRVYEAPYFGICEELFGRGDAYEILKSKFKVEFLSTSFLRGTTMSDCIIIIDEFQNMNEVECHTIMSRVGENSKVLICGDFRQTDLVKDKDKQGLAQIIRTVDRMRSFDHVEFTKEDVVRSGFAKEYIFARDSLGLA